MARNYHDIIEYYEARGQKTFSLDSLAILKNLNRAAAKNTISKLIRMTMVKPLADGFYAIVSPSERQSGVIPPDTFIDQLMAHECSSYYVGLLSAASFYGASHHRPMMYQVVTNSRVRLSKRFIMGIKFYTKKDFPQSLIVKKNGPFGYINFSSPILTAYDVVNYESETGTLNNGIVVLEELLPQIRSSDIRKLMKNKLATSVLLRLGYLLEKLHRSDLSDLLLPVVRNATAYVRLSVLGGPDGNMDLKWKIVENVKLELPVVTPSQS